MSKFMERHFETMGVTVPHQIHQTLTDYFLFSSLPRAQDKIQMSPKEGKLTEPSSQSCNCTGQPPLLTHPKERLLFIS